MRKQIATVLSTNEGNIRQLKVEKGSIMVFFRLVGYQDEAGDLANSYKQLVDILAKGSLKLVISKPNMYYLIV